MASSKSTTDTNTLVKTTLAPAADFVSGADASQSTTDVKVTDTATTAETTPPAPIVETPVVTDTVKPAIVDMKADTTTPTTDTTTVTMDAPIVIDTASADTQVTETSSETTESDFEKMVKQVQASGNAVFITLLNSLQMYVNKMKPGVPMTGAQGVNHQFGLWKALEDFINTEMTAGDFKKGWNIVLAFFKEHSEGVFNSKYVFRFAESWIWSDVELKCLQRLTNLIQLTCDPSKKEEGLKSVNVNKTVEEGLTEEGKQRILTFYNVQ